MGERGVRADASTPMAIVLLPEGGKSGWQVGSARRRSSRERQSPLGLGDGAAEAGGRLDPLAGDLLDVGQGPGLRRAVGTAAGKLGDFGDEGLIVLAPVDDDLDDTRLREDVVAAAVRSSKPRAPSRFRRASKRIV